MISRAWVGPELEGFRKGILTLYIEGLVPTSKEVLECYTKASKKINQPIQRIYFGAGGVGVKEIVDIDALVDFSLDYNIDLVSEVLLDQFYECDLEVLKNTEVILSVKGKKAYCIDFIKFDNYKEVEIYNYLSNMPEKTDLSDLKNGMFSQDVLIYKEK